MDINLEEDYEIINASPAARVESDRAFGYSAETSVADLIDNSITANAKNVWVEFVWNGINSSLRILDDGEGMDEETLKNSMRMGSMNPRDKRSKDDLGRFGLGLKTASFAHCRSLTVASKTKETDYATRIWDLDVISDTDQYRLGKKPTSENSRIIEEKLSDNMKSGTLIIWDKLDRMVGDSDPSDEKTRKAFYDTANRIESHLSMVFHRYLEGPSKVNIYMGNQKSESIKSWDPFMKKEAYTSTLEEELVQFFQEPIRIQPYVLPHHSTITPEKHEQASGVKGWNAHQGFYIYRNRRLLVPGSWLNIGNWKQEEHYKLARIQVDLPNTLDDTWGLDVKKSEARIPTALRADFRKIGSHTRKRATEVYRFRGKSTRRKHAEKHEFIWNTKTFRNKKVKYTVNRDHPLITSLNSALGKDEKEKLEAILKFVEETIPREKIIIDSSENPDSHIQSFEKFTSSQILSLIRIMYQTHIDLGDSPKLAIKKLKVNEAFEQFPEYLGLFTEEIKSA